MIERCTKLECLLKTEVERLEKDVEEATMFGIVGTCVGVISLCAAVAAMFTL